MPTKVNIKILLYINRCYATLDRRHIHIELAEVRLALRGKKVYRGFRNERVQAYGISGICRHVYIY